MSVADLIVVVAGSAATVITIAAFLLVRRHPENAASHTEVAPPADSSGRSALSGRVKERPAGPGAEGEA